MGLTITEKILARVSRDGRVARAGDEIEVKPDFVLAYDFPGYLDTWFAQMRDEFGVERVREPNRFAMFIDHMLVGARASEEAVHQITRDWCRDNSVPLFERAGIGHQVAIEEGYAVSGSFSIHFDGHTSQLGTYGALSIGVHKQVLEALVRDYITYKVPRTTRVNLHGALAPGVTARDVFNHLLLTLGPAFCRFQVLELGGEGLASISLDGRQTITCLAMFTGALTAIVNPMPDALAQVASKARIKLDPVSSDADARYAAVHDVDLDAVVPLVVKPPSPANVCPIDAFVGLPVDVGYIGSCSSGRIEDLREAAAMLKGRRIKEGFKLNVMATSQAIMAQAAREGLIATLVDAGALVSASSCDLCFGYVRTVHDRQRAVSTGTLNTPGRMGSATGEIYLCSAATVAATALKGAIADPRDHLPAVSAT